MGGRRGSQGVSTGGGGCRACQWGVSTGDGGCREWGDVGGVTGRLRG